MKLPALLFSLILPLTAADSWVLYVQEGDNGRKALAFCRALLAEEGQAPGKVIPLRETCSTFAEAQQQAKAIEDGVTTLPCLVLPGVRGGDNIALPLEGLTREKLAECRRAHLASSPQTEEVQKRRFDAHLYLLCARVGLTPLDDAALARAVQESRRLLRHQQIRPDQQQFIGLRLLYPLLMEQYRRGYEGAHTPETEAKLLEAIAALEEARDIDPRSALGRRAYEERERLRMARRKSRQYE